MSGTQEASQWRFLITPRWLGWTAFVIAAIAGMLWLGDWQLRRALAGNTLSWAYTFEWPIFAIFGVVFWVKTVRDELKPPAAAYPAPAADGAGLPVGARAASGAGSPGQDGPGEEADDPELAAYNAYLARLNQQ